MQSFLNALNSSSLMMSRRYVWSSKEAMNHLPSRTSESVSLIPLTAP